MLVGAKKDALVDAPDVGLVELVETLDDGKLFDLLGRSRNEVLPLVLPSQPGRHLHGEKAHAHRHQDQACTAEDRLQAVPPCERGLIAR
jgi:hypothetical protein